MEFTRDVRELQITGVTLKRLIFKVELQKI